VEESTREEAAPTYTQVRRKEGEGRIGDEGEEE
jgi:hypothetical protein